ncbi:MAG: hypothetical protein QOF59_2087 [Actinomycetota bacterium]|nr:hypothetical protein [Actinomycetota bacterium]
MIIGMDAGQSVAGPFLLACALLVVAGVGKITHPGPTRAAVLAAGLGVPRFVVVGFGIVELGAGGAGAVFGGRAAMAVAACYVLLTVFAVCLLVRAPTAPCACLGSSSSVVTRTHVVLDGAAVAVALVAAFGQSPFAQLSGRWVSGAVFAVLVLCGVQLAALALEALPELTGAIKEGVDVSKEAKR